MHRPVAFFLFLKTFFLFLTLCLVSQGQDTFSPLQEGDAIPQNVTDLWKGYDPRAEPIEKEILKTYEEEGCVCEYILYTVATFKGKPSRVAAFYTYPKGGKNLPAFVWAHGGGQRADRSRGLHFAKKGYASIDINWNGSELDPEVKKNTDWGNIDPTQGKPYYPLAPRKKRNTGIEPDEYSVDPVISPRNKYWFMLAVAGRRAITFLEEQEEVDPERIGFTGFSMGGNITSFCAIDKRLKAVVPIVGGTGFAYDPIPGYPKSGAEKHYDLIKETISPEAYWPHVTAPVLFISGTNDFHGRLDYYQRCIERLPEGTRWTMSQTLHNNHSPSARQMLALEMWFQHYLKEDGAEIPESPTSSLKKNSETSWTFTVTPDALSQVREVNVYYSWDTAIINRYNKPVASIRKGESWEAELPAAEGLPLTVFADVVYEAEGGKTVETLRGKTGSFSLTSAFHKYVPDSLHPESFMKEVPQGEFQPLFSSFPEDNLMWENRKKIGEILTYKFNDYALSFPPEKALKFSVNPHDQDLTLTVFFSSLNHRLRAHNEMKRTLIKSQHFKGTAGEWRISLEDLFKEKKEGGEDRITAWEHIDRMRVSLQNRKTGEKIDLLGPESGKYLEKIEWE